MSRNPAHAASRAFADRLGLAFPLIQAPMAGYQGAAMAGAVSRAGGLGSLPGAALAPAALRDAVATIRAQAGGARGAAVNLNFFCHTPPVADPGREAAWRAALKPFYDELGVDPATIASGPGRLPFDEDAVAAVEALRPEVVSFHFGLPAPALLARVRASGAQVWSSATTVAEALWLEAQGVDAVIAQGAEAGGHRATFLLDGREPDVATQIGTMALLPQVAAAVRVPVIASGGIADAAGIAAALRLGAAAVQLGTAFLLCDEATTSAVHRAALQSEAARHTALTNLFTGRPARGIVNRLMREFGSMSARSAVPEGARTAVREHGGYFMSVLAPAFPSAVNAVAPLRAAAEQAGLGDFSPLWAGQNVQGCRAVPAAQLVEALAAGFEAD